ncbi:MAG: SH3 domain-containing protein [Chloroflexota bacterium]
MKRKSLITIAAAFSMALAVAAPTLAQTPAPTSTPIPATAAPTAVPLTATTSLFATANFLVNVRSGPGTEYTVLGKAHKDDALDITGKLADSSWWRVNFNGQEGWVLASLFNPTGDLTTAPEAVAGTGAVLKNGATTTTGAATAVPGAVVGTTTGSVNLRAIPATSGAVLVIIPFSTELTATGRTSGNNWVQVSYNNHTGWITSAVYSVSRGNVINLPVFDEAGVAVPATAAPTARPTVAATATTSP